MILTLPFGVLRNLDYRNAGFDRLKCTAIEELGYGTNTKLILQCSERLWNDYGPWGIGDGNMYTDLFFQNTWDSSRGTPGKAGLLVAFLGRSEALQFAGAAPPFATAATSLDVVRCVEEWPDRGKSSLARDQLTVERPGHVVYSLESAQSSRQLFVLEGRPIYEVQRL